jgi:hypothetical protein
MEDGQNTMVRHSTKKDGIEASTIESAAGRPSSVLSVTHARYDIIHGKDAVVPSRFSHLASRIVRDWQRFGQHTNDMPYFGTPLDTQGSIRLLVLEPGAIDDAVICELSLENIRDLPPFEALSYTWGDPEQRTPITIAGETFQVTANLATALRYLRHSDRPRLLWVDALCINQRNALEVNAQIQYMVDIYGSASSVLAWLGPDDGSVCSAFNAIRTVADTISPEDVSLLTEIFSRPYWTRLWVVQELVLARDIQFVCGREYLPWETVDRFYGSAPANGKTPFDILPGALRHLAYRLRHIWHARQIIIEGERLSFSQLLNKYNPCRCSEPKDYVYSLLGLAAPFTAIHQLIQPDYTTETSTEEVFRDATAATIIEDQNLNILCLVRRHWDHSIDSPPRLLSVKTSWVGDWSCVRAIRPLIEPDNSEQLYSVYESGSFSEEDNLLHKNDGILRTHGAIFDTLGVVRPQVSPLAQDWEHKVQSWEPPNIQTYQYPTGEDPIDAFWRTLIFDDGFTLFHQIHARLTLQQKDEYRKLYLQWRYGVFDSNRLDSRSFARSIRWSPLLQGWTFAVTRKRYFARLQPDAESGDVVVLLRGGAVPFILRPVINNDLGEKGDVIHKGGAWRLIGTAYVHGIMDGEAMASMTLSAEQDFYIV